jgi:hypothetical protein
LISSLGLRTGHAQSRSGIEKSRALSVTGCLVKGDESKEAWLAQKDGTIYGLASSKIDLNANLGQRVVVSGYLLSEGNKEAGAKPKSKTKRANVKCPIFVYSRSK